MSNVTIEITVSINGEPHRIEDCAWFFIAPCGCTHGVMTTRDYEHNSWITSPEQALAGMTPNRAVREQDKARGERVELGLHADVKTRLGNDCPHTPQWGHAPIPEGTAWGHASSGRSAHLVDQELPDDGDYRTQWRDPKCGAKRDIFDIGPWALSEAPMCKKCLKYAEQQTLPFSTEQDTPEENP